MVGHDTRRTAPLLNNTRATRIQIPLAAALPGLDRRTARQGNGGEQREGWGARRPGRFMRLLREGKGYRSTRLRAR